MDIESIHYHYSSDGEFEVERDPTIIAGFDHVQAFLGELVKCAGHQPVRGSLSTYVESNIHVGILKAAYASAGVNSMRVRHKGLQYKLDGKGFLNYLDYCMLTNNINSMISFTGGLTDVARDHRGRYHLYAPRLTDEYEGYCIGELIDVEFEIVIRGKTFYPNIIKSFVYRKLESIVTRFTSTHGLLTGRNSILNDSFVEVLSEIVSFLPEEEVNSVKGLNSKGLKYIVENKLSDLSTPNMGILQFLGNLPEAAYLYQESKRAWESANCNPESYDRLVRLSSNLFDMASGIVQSRIPNIKVLNVGLYPEFQRIGTIAGVPTSNNMILLI